MTSKNVETVVWNFLPKRHGTPLAVAVLGILRNIQNAVNKATGSFALFNKDFV